MAKSTAEDNDATGAIGATRDQFIPVRKTDIIEALIARGELDAAAQDKFRTLCRLLGSIYHYTYFAQLEKLRDAYFYFDPEIATHPRLDRAALDAAYEALIESLHIVLKGANFSEVPHAEIEAAHNSRAMLRVEVAAPLDDFRDVRFFRRGQHVEKLELRKWFGLRKRVIAADVYDDVIMLVATKPQIAPDRKRSRQKLRPDSVLIKFFRSIASADLNALFPNVRVVLSLGDKLWLGVPALLGGIPLLLKLASTITVLFLVIGFYLGTVSAVKDDQLKAALAAASGVVALVTFMMGQWVKYHSRSLAYQKEITDNIYYRNINNNSGVFDYIISAAEEQECKEAFLAYYFLLTAGDRPDQSALDRRIEAWLAEAFGIDVDFEIDDALGKLERLGVLVRNGDILSVMPLDAALARLDREWDDFFRFAPPVSTETAA